MKKTLLVLTAVLMMASTVFAQELKMPVKKQQGKVAVSSLNLNRAANNASASKSTINVVCNEMEITDFTAESGYGDWYVEMATADGSYVIYFDILTTSLVPGTTYTYTDMDANYTIMVDYINQQYVTPTAASFTLTVGADGLQHVVASISGDDGNTYNITYDEQPVPTEATDTIDMVMTTNIEIVDATATQSVFQFVGENATNLVYAAFYSNQIPGTYTNDDIYLDYTAIYDINTELEVSRVVSGDAVITATTDGYQFEAYYLCMDAHCYHVSMTYVPPVATDTIDIVITDGVELNDLTAVMGAFQFMGANEEYGVSATFYGSQVPGTYTTDDIYADYTAIYDPYTGQDVSTVYSGDAEVTATTDGYQLEAYYLCTDNHCYHVSMTYTIPVAEDTIELVIPTSEFEDYSDYDGSYLFFGTTADQQYAAQITYFANQITGSFTFDDFDASYTFIAEGQSQKTVFDGNLNVTATANGYHLDAYLLCTDNHCYHVNMDYYTSGINDVNDVKVAVYPNPATEKINVVADGVQEINVIDANGRTVMTSAQAGSIDVSALANGIYMVRTITNNGVNVQRIVKK